MFDTRYCSEPLSLWSDPFIKIIRKILIIVSTSLECSVLRSTVKCTSTVPVGRARLMVAGNHPPWVICASTTCPTWYGCAALCFDWQVETVSFRARTIDNLTVTPHYSHQQLTSADCLPACTRARRRALAAFSSSSRFPRSSSSFFSSTGSKKA